MNWNVIYTFILMLCIISCKPAEESLKSVTKDETKKNLKNELNKGFKSNNASFNEFLELFPDRDLEFEFSGLDYEKYEFQERLIPFEFHKTFLCNEKYDCQSSESESKFWAIAKVPLNENIMMLVIQRNNSINNDIPLLLYNTQGKLINHQLISSNFPKKELSRRGRIFSDKTMWIQETIGEKSNRTDLRYSINEDGTFSEEEK